MRHGTDWCHKLIVLAIVCEETIVFYTLMAKRSILDSFSPFCFSLTVWSDDDWLKKFSGKTLEENVEEEGAEPARSEAQEVQRHDLGLWVGGCSAL